MEIENILPPRDAFLYVGLFMIISIETKGLSSEGCLLHLHLCRVMCVQSS